MREEKPWITRSFWKDLRTEIKQQDPTLCDLIDRLPGHDFPLFKMRYTYGSTIYDRGVFYLPGLNGNTQPISDYDGSLDLKDQLTYAAMPLGFLAHHGFEVFQEINQHVIPRVYRQKRSFNIGIWETFAPPSPFTVTAGARSIFMLPKITDAIGHKKLKTYGVHTTIPRSLFDQWHIFKTMANHPHFPDEWFTEIIFFGKGWLDKMKNNVEWITLWNYVLQKGLDYAQKEYLKLTCNSIFTVFSALLNKNRIKRSAHISETLRCLIYVAAGILPAFKVVPSTHGVAPARSIAEIYVREYGLKHYYPTLMYADRFRNHPNECAYYSLQLPIFSLSTPHNKVSNTTRQDLIELRDLLDRFMQELSRGTLGFASEFMRNLFSRVKLDFFHSEGQDNEIKSPLLMPEEDPALINTQGLRLSEREFCHTSGFLKGCIRISSC